MATVSFAQIVRDKLRAWAPIAARLGLWAAFTAAVREMEDRLRTDPESWGDPVRDYHGLRATQYYRYGPLLFVDYAVHIDGTPVFVLNVEPTPGTDLFRAVQPPSS